MKESIHPLLLRKFSEAGIEKHTQTQTHIMFLVFLINLLPERLMKGMSYPDYHLLVIFAPVM